MSRRLKGDKKEIDAIIPVEERLSVDEFNRLWNMIYDEVVAMWEDSGEEKEPSNNKQNN